MATVTLSALSEVMKDAYEKAVPYFLNTTLPLWNFLKLKQLPFAGEPNFVIPMQLSLNEGSAWQAENDATPTALIPTFDQCQLSWKKLVGAMRVSEETIDLTKGANTLIDGLKRNVESLVKAVKLDLDQAMHGDGTGKLAQSSAVDDGQVITCATGVHNIRVGMVLDGYDLDATPNNDAANVVVTAVDLVNNQFTVTGAITNVDAVTAFYKNGTHTGALGSATAPNGLDNIVSDTGTFQNCDRSSLAFMQAIEIDGASAGTAESLTFSRMRSVGDRLTRDMAGEVGDLIYTSIGVKNAFVDLMRADHQPIEAMPNKWGFTGSHKYVYDGKEIPIVASRLAAMNSMFFLSRKHMFKYLGTMGFADRDGFLQRIAGYLAYEAIWRAWVNFGTDMPRSLGRLNDITEA